MTLLKSPGEFAFEWVKWPDHSKQGGLFGTGDFAAKAAACEHWVDQDRISPCHALYQVMIADLSQ